MMPRVLALAAAGLLCGAFACSSLAQEPGAADASAGGHGATSNRTFEDVQHWTAVFDDPNRDAWQKPAELVAALGLSAGATVADLGAGTGYLAPYLSRAVGPDGTVLLVDTEPTLIEHMRSRAEAEGLRNATPVLASANNPRIPRGSADLVLIVDTFHHINDRVTYARGLRETLRPGGRIAIIDWQKRELPVGPKGPHKLARAHIVTEMKQAGYEIVEEPDVLPYQYFLIFRPAPTPPVP